MLQSPKTKGERIMEHKLSKAEYKFLYFLYKKSSKKEQYKINFTDSIMSPMETPLKSTMKLLNQGYITFHNEWGHEVSLPIVNTYARITSDGMAYIDTCRSYKAELRMTRIIAIAALIISLFNLLWNVISQICL